ncbi:MAG: choline monooxygenase [Parasphingorhabdus sp.]|jgi:choline monooxygenase
MSLKSQDPGVLTFFDQQLVDRLNAKTEDGSALPNIAYTSEAFYKLEQQTVFRRTWAFAEFAHKFENPGDMIPVEVAGQPLVLVKGPDNEIRAFHNVCRHRGARLVSEVVRGKKNFVCPNHSWSYSLKGSLLARPHFHGGEKHDVNRSECHRADLVQVRCDTWHDWVFVNLDGNAADLREYIQPITSQLEAYDFNILNFGDSIEFEIKANWKLAIENFIEPYHVFSCHPWLNSFVSMAERDPPTFKDHVLQCGYSFQKTDPARGEGLPYFPDLPVEKQNRGDWFVLFPNFAFEIFPDQVDVFIATPLGFNQCRETIALYFVGDGASSPDYTKGRNTVIRNWHDLNNEDIGVIERMQAGRSSDGFDGGVLSPYWDPVLQHFARLIYHSMEDAQ